MNAIQFSSRNYMLFYTTRLHIKALLVHVILISKVKRFMKCLVYCIGQLLFMNTKYWKFPSGKNQIHEFFITFIVSVIQFTNVITTCFDDIFLLIAKFF